MKCEEIVILFLQGRTDECSKHAQTKKMARKCDSECTQALYVVLLQTASSIHTQY